MEQHLRIVGWLQVVNGVLLLVFTVLIATLMAGAGAVSGEPGAFALMAGLGGAIAVFGGVLSLPSILGGWGILTYKPWSRTLVLILSFLNLLNLPVGTLVGGYSIWVLLNDEARRLLEQGNPRYYPLP